MKNIIRKIDDAGSTSREARAGERGQMLPFMAISMIAVFAIGAFVVDVGRIYYTFHQLQAATDAAALAGGSGLPSSTNAVADANSYGAVSGNHNVLPGLGGVTMVSGYPKVECLTTLKNQGLACDGTSTYNAIQVKQTVALPMTFGNISSLWGLGTPNVTLTATATASARGSYSIPYNIAVIIDTTASMGQGGSDSCTDPTNNESYTTSEECALVGVKLLLLNTAPCVASLSTCPGGATNSVDMVSLFTFPNGTANTMDDDYSNGCGGPTIASTYSFPILGATTYAPTGTASDYQVTPYLSDFRTNDQSTTLTSTSDLTAAIGQKSGCAGLQTPGGLGTYYAGALVAAQAADLANQALTGREGSQNAIILLSDGAANASKMATYETNGTTKVSTTAYTYPSTINQCQQAIDAATQITATGTIIYTVAYGALTGTSNSNSGCTTDSSGPNANISPCTALEKMASTPATFFTDTPSGGGNCSSAEQPANGLATIFTQIAYSFTFARLIPDGTT